MTRPLIGIGSDILQVEGERERAFVFLTYVEALRKAGAIAVLIPPQPESVRDLVASLDGILLAGGDDCDPTLYGERPHASVEPMDVRRQANELEIARTAREAGIPTLGVCLGMQMMNVAGGGSLVQDIDSQVGSEIRHTGPPENRSRHDVRVEGGTRLASLVPALELNVNSSHHQAIARMADGLRASAHAPDGIVEGLEDPNHPFYIGVQWHPEDMSGESSASTIFGSFVEAARRHAKLKRETGDLSPAVGGSPE